MRIFIGIDLDDNIRGKLARFLEGVSGFAPEARWVRPESLHITLKFIGEQKQEQVEAITQRLRLVESDPFEIHVSGYGFFPTAKSPRVFWIGIQAGPQLAQLASDIDAAVARAWHSARRAPIQPAPDAGASGRKVGKKLGRSEVARRRRAELDLRRAAKAAGGDGRA